MTDTAQIRPADEPHTNLWHDAWYRLRRNRLAVVGLVIVILLALVAAIGERAATVHALDDFTLDILAGETLSLVGESGCGKSTTGFCILNLHRPSGGEVIYRGAKISGLDEAAMRPLRRDLQIVFQDPYSTLDPRMTIREAVAEPMLFHRLATKAEVPARLAQLLGDVDPPPGCRFHTRCPIARDICGANVPDWREVAPGHHLACHAVEATETPNWGASLA
jgi:oligopeptide/dipeptide ABC transporter ATP-binding protein